MKLAFLVGTMAIVLWSQDLLACSDAPFLPSTLHTIDPSQSVIDKTPPGPVEITIVKLKRGENSPSHACGGQTGCTPMGGISIEIVPAVDDRTDEQSMGYLVESTPARFMDQGPDGSPTPVRATNRIITEAFFDNPDNDLDFTFTIRAVDLAGNVGEPSDPVRITSLAPGGCNLGGLPGSIWLAWAALLFLVIRRRS